MILFLPKIIQCNALKTWAPVRVRIPMLYGTKR